MSAGIISAGIIHGLEEEAMTSEELEGIRARAWDSVTLGGVELPPYKPIVDTGRPMCAVCGVRVERFEMEDRDILTQETIFMAYCHGEQQVVAVGDELFEGGNFAGFGEVFVESGARELGI